MNPSARRRQVTVAGHTGDVDCATRGLDDPDGTVRAAALGALGRLRALTAPAVSTALDDPDPRVRLRAAELAAGIKAVDLIPSLGDDDPAVVETAAWACGEQGSATAVEALTGLTREHPEALCREAAVAALGAIGKPEGLPAILAACQDKPAVRRRAVIALAPFDGPEVEAALATALEDRDWQVRQAAEELSENRSP